MFFEVNIYLDGVKLEGLVDVGFTRSAVAHIRYNQCLEEWLQSFTYYARKNLIYDRLILQ